MIVYYFKPSTDKTRAHEYDVLFTQHDSDPEPRYILRHPDPAVPLAKNVYAAAIVDAYIPDIVFGEVLMRPSWSQPTLSAEEIRKNGGLAPPPVPLVPQDFVVQLYDPEQQIVITEQPGGFAGSPSWTFSVPQMTFRQPSVSALDRGQHDPVADVTTPKMHYAFKRESKFSKDITCYLTGRSTDNASKKRGGKEPSVPVAILTNNYRDLQIYESNLHRFELEDYKGFEITLLLASRVIRDVYLGQRKDFFNIGDSQGPRKNSSGPLARLRSSSSTANLPLATADVPLTTSPSHINTGRTPPSGPPPGRRPSQPPPPDPRLQWELDNESARLRIQEDTNRKMLERQRREQEKRDAEEAKRMQKLLDAEARDRQKEQARRQADIDRETERLKRQFGDQASLFPPLPPRPSNRHSAPGPPAGFNMPGAYPSTPPPGHNRPPAQSGPYMQVPGANGRPAASQSSFFGESPNGQGGQGMKPKRSFFGLRREGGSDEHGGLTAEQQRQRLSRKKSSNW